MQANDATTYTFYTILTALLIKYFKQLELIVITVH